MLDLGCGSGQWLRELLGRRADLTAVGVDLHPATDPAAFATDLGGRAVIEVGDASTWQGGLSTPSSPSGSATSSAARAGRWMPCAVTSRPAVACCSATPSGTPRRPRRPCAALEATAEEFPDLSGLTRLTREHGYEVGARPRQQPRGVGRVRVVLDRVAHRLGPRPGRDAADREQALAAAADHRDAWLDGYRGVLGFVTLVLVDRAGLS